MKCKRPNCPNLARTGGRGFCNKHYALTPKGYVAPERCREHLRKLRAAGYSYRALAEITGLDRTCLSMVGLRTFERVTLETHVQIMRVPLPAGFVSGGSQRVPNVGTRRRLLSLMAAGHSQYALADELGVSQQCVAHWEKVPMVTGETAGRIAELFDRLQLVPGTSKRAMTWAKRKGGHPPFCWDEDTIDDPRARPHVPREGRDLVSRLDQVRELKAFGLTDDMIAQRMGIQRKSLERILLRAS